MQRRTELSPDTERLSRSTLHRIIRRRLIPQTRERMEAYLVACDLAVHKRPAWMEAWKRVRATTENERDRRRRSEQERAQEVHALIAGPPQRGEGEAPDAEGRARADREVPRPSSAVGSALREVRQWGRFRFAQVVLGEAGCVVCRAAHLGCRAPR
ncbi:hypothetical protein [Streptomyces sp. NRRL F-2580]|uniref:hypothetical protein n=1 Tax=Streptomyces sp. NRRL F-2580 TaxID=1463841 RepID=UPI0004C9D985|nr:hypothetical protein [Streptomyces sp. NRRL F-2580]